MKRPSHGATACGHEASPQRLPYVRPAIPGMSEKRDPAGFLLVGDTFCNWKERGVGQGCSGRRGLEGRVS